MKKMSKYLFFTVILVILVFPLNISASTLKKNEKEESYINIAEIAKYQNNSFKNKNSNEIIITDPTVIHKYASSQGFPNVENITMLKIKVGVTDNRLSDTVTLPPQKKATYRTFISDIVDCGNGYTLSGHYNENRYEGPISGTYSHSRTDSCEFTATASVSSQIVSAGVGFTIGNSITSTDSVTINVPSGKRVILKISTNYNKKSFTIYREYSDSTGLWYRQGTGDAYKPVGLIFTQAYY